MENDKDRSKEEVKKSAEIDLNEVPSQLVGTRETDPEAQKMLELVQQPLPPQVEAESEDNEKSVGGALVSPVAPESAGGSNIGTFVEKLPVDPNRRERTFIRKLTEARQEIGRLRNICNVQKAELNQMKATRRSNGVPDVAFQFLRDWWKASRDRLLVSVEKKSLKQIYELLAQIEKVSNKKENKL